MQHSLASPTSCYARLQCTHTQRQRFSMLFSLSSTILISLSCYRNTSYNRNSNCYSRKLISARARKLSQTTAKFISKCLLRSCSFCPNSDTLLWNSSWISTTTLTLNFTLLLFSSRNLLIQRIYRITLFLHFPHSFILSSCSPTRTSTTHLYTCNCSFRLCITLLRDTLTFISTRSSMPFFNLLNNKIRIRKA